MEQFYQEAYVNITADDRRSARINRMVLQVAKKNNDPLYIKYLAANKRRLAIRERLRQKYYSAAKNRVV